MHTRTTPAAALAALMLLSCSVRERKQTYPGPGDPLPRFCVTDNGGVRVTSDDLSSGDAVIAFFNTGCRDCREELPELQRFHDRDGGVRMLLISREEDSSSVSHYWADNALTMPYAACTGRTVYSLFAESRIPRTYAVREGTILAAWDDSRRTYAEEIEETFQNNDK